MIKKTEFSILFGGKAGDGIRQLGTLWAKLLSRQGYRVFLYDDYPSLIRGGHNFTIVRASSTPVLAHNEVVDLVAAFNQESIERHAKSLKPDGKLLYDADLAETSGIGVPWSSIVGQAKAGKIMRNTAVLASAAKLLAMDWSHLEHTVRSELPKSEKNLEVARLAWEATPEPVFELAETNQEPWPVMYGNEAIALGAVGAGLKSYIAYPMTPASSILHYLAAYSDDLGITVIHPENEIAAVLMAIGSSYAGIPAMVGTSGGGLALMVEAISLSAQSETPLLLVECQRPGPSTGVPTYTMQGDLNFVLNAGHGEFLRVVLAPGDASEAFHLSGLALYLAWKYQIPSFLLSDKHLSESLFCQSIDPGRLPKIEYKAWDAEGRYKRYMVTEDGVSPLAFPGTAGIAVKATSYEHDEFGITTEEPGMIEAMQAKRLAKRPSLNKELDKPELVTVGGNEDSETALITWGSNKGAVLEAAEELSLRYVQPLCLEPFLESRLKSLLSGVSRVITVECNATAPFTNMLKAHGINIDHTIVRYDGRPFSVDGLLAQLKQEVPL